MSCSLLNLNGVVYANFSAEVTDEDLSKLAEFVLRADHEAERTPHRVADFTHATKISFHMESVVGLAKNRMKLQEGIKTRVRTAIVAPHAKQRVVARLFKAVNRHPLVTVEIFRDTASAREWVEKI